MSKFYTHFNVRGNTILHTGYENGRKFFRKEPYSPSLFIPTKRETEYKTFDGKTQLGRIQFSNISEARDYVNQYSDVEGHTIYGLTQYEYAFISDMYRGEVPYDLKQLKILYFDIETTAEQGFPDMQTFNEKVIAITCIVGNLCVVLAYDPFASSRSQKYVADENVHYIECGTENELLVKFVEFIKDQSPDIISGYNSDFFDIPYLVGRMDRIIEPGYAKNLSPWKEIRTRRMSIGGREYVAHDFLGIVSLDYMEVYKKFANKRPENYRLDTLARDELKNKKVEYSGTYRDLYTKDWQKFIDYNIQDVLLVKKLEEKLKLIEMIITIAYESKVNFIDVFKQVRLWDIIIFNFLREKKLVVPPKSDSDKSEKYAGAAVKDPIIGMHDWVVSFDVNSLYPMLIVQYNISPEKLLDDGKQDVIIDLLLNKEYNLDFLKTKNACMTANGYQFDRNGQGFLPEIIETMYKERKIYKRKMLESQALLQSVKEELQRRKA